MFAAMAQAAFRWLWISALSHSSSRFAVITVTGWLAYSISGSAVGSGLAMFLALGPALVVAPTIGALADWRDRRQLMSWGAMLACAVCIVAGVVTYLGDLSLTWVYLVVLAAGVAGAVEQPTRTAMITSVVDAKTSLNGFALMSMAVRGAELVGPAVATLLLVASGPTAALALCALLYALTALAVRFVPMEPVKPATPRWRQIPQDIASGASYVARTPPIGGFLLFTSFHCALTMAYMGLLPMYAARTAGLGSEAFGLLMTCVGLGAVLGPMALSAFAKQGGGARLLLICAFASGLSLAGLGISSGLWLAGAMAALIGASQTVFMVLVRNVMQSRAAETMRGRVASLSFSSNAGLMGVFGLVYGAIAAAHSASGVMMVVGSAFALVTVVFMALMRELRWNADAAAEGGRELRRSRSRSREAKSGGVA